MQYECMGSSPSNAEVEARYEQTRKIVQGLNHKKTFAGLSVAEKFQLDRAVKGMQSLEKRLNVYSQGANPKIIIPEGASRTAIYLQQPTNPDMDMPIIEPPTITPGVYQKEETLAKGGGVPPVSGPEASTVHGPDSSPLADEAVKKKFHIVPALLAAAAVWFTVK